MPVLLVLFLTLCALSQRTLGDEIGLVRIGETWRFLPATNEPPHIPIDWRAADFNDSNWIAAPSGFSTSSYYPEQTILTNYGLGYFTVYFRKCFTAPDVSRVAELIFRVDYDDGFVAYLNGAEIARRGITGQPGEPVAETAVAALHARGVTEEILVTNGPALLRAGTNVLAVQLHGSGVFDYTACFVSELLANLTRGPFIQNSTSNSVQVIWKTAGPTSGWIEFGTNIAEAARIDVDEINTNHVATLTNLSPDTEYLYRVGARYAGNQTATDWRSFKTFKAAGDISFNVIGDSGWVGPGQFAIAKLLGNTPADFVFHLGDLIYYSFTHYASDFRLFSVYANEMRERPWFLAVGNHEMFLDRNAALESFYLPTNNPSGSEFYYSFDHGDVHVVAIWTDIFMGADYKVGSAQYQWLESDLARTTKPWKFLLFHHVWRSSSIHHWDDYDYNTVLDSVQLEQGPIQLARKYGVQVIFNGHDHGYQRLMPGDGPMSFISGGGGALLYPFSTLHPDMVQFYQRYNFLNVSVRGEEMTVKAIADDGKILDTLTLRRDWPTRTPFQAVWNTPFIEAGPPNNGDGNVAGQRFDFTGEPVTAHLGRFTSAGRLFVNNDDDNIYLGFDQVMIRAGEELFAFIQSTGRVGLASMEEVGNGLVDPDGEGADGLDFLANLVFTNFTPAIGIILGDEYGDAPDKSFRRAGQSMKTGQGAFYLSPGLAMVPGQRLTQFNHSPEDSPPVYLEQNSDFIKIALPFESLGIGPGDMIKIGAIVGLTNINVDFSAQSRALDNGGIACSVRELNGLTYLEPVEIRLATNALGATAIRVRVEQSWPDQLTIKWNTVPGRHYQLQSSENLPGVFEDVSDPVFPKAATSWKDSYNVQINSNPASFVRYYRIKLLPE